MWKNSQNCCKYSSGTFFYIDGHYQSIYDHISGVPMPSMAMKFQRFNNPEKSKHRKRQLSNLSMEISMERTQMGSFFFLMIIFLIFYIYHIFSIHFIFRNVKNFIPVKLTLSILLYYSRVLFYSFSSIFPPCSIIPGCSIIREVIVTIHF